MATEPEILRLQKPDDGQPIPCATTDEIVEHRNDPGLPQITRSGLLAYECWQSGEWRNIGDRRVAVGPSSVFYLDINRDREAAVMTNHLSPIKYHIVRGTGYFATRAGISEFERAKANSKRSLTFKVGRGEPHCYGGEFQALVEFAVPPLVYFTTFDNEKLGKEARSTLARTARCDRRERLLGQAAQRLFPNFEETITQLANLSGRTAQLDL